MNGDHLLLRLFPSNLHIYSEWLDGLNLVKSLTNQAPHYPLSITEDPNQNNNNSRNHESGAGHMVQNNNKQPSAANSHQNLQLLPSVEGTMSTQETAELVYSLTQIGTMIKLLDLTGERVEVPKSVHVMFFFVSQLYFLILTNLPTVFLFIHPAN